MLAFAVSGWLGGFAEREVNVYKDNERADIVNTNSLDGTITIIELKCQSFYQDEDDINAFSRAIIKDLNKVNYSGRNPDYQEKPIYVIGIGVSGAGVFNAIEEFSKPDFGYRDQIFWTQATDNSPFIFLGHILLIFVMISLISRGARALLRLRSESE